MKTIRISKSQGLLFGVTLASLMPWGTGPLLAQATGGSTAAAGTTANAAPRQSGTVKAVTPRDLVLTNASGQDFAVNVSAGTKILLVDPVTRDVKAARPGTIADIAAGDKAVINGTTGDTGQTLTATRILLLKSGAIAAMHATEQAAWARSVGGLVRSVDAGTGMISVTSGTRTIAVQTSPATVVRRYAPGSVRFEDAQKSTVAAIEPGDQIQARGQRSPDGLTVTADEIVTGSFTNLSGVLTAVDPTAGTVSLKDLATKRPVTVQVSAQANLRRLPADFGREAGSVAGAQGAAGPPASGTGHAGAEHPGASGTGQGAATTTGQGAGQGATRRLDISRVINRLPKETVADLKPGDAVMIVASRSQAGGDPTAITMVSGVERILAASPSGESTLSPWNLGSEEGEGGGEGAGGGGGR